MSSKDDLSGSRSPRRAAAPRAPAATGRARGGGVTLKRPRGAPREEPSSSVDPPERSAPSTGDASSEGEGDDIINVGMQELLEEYRARPGLDRYDERGLDEREYAPISQDARAAAEAELAARDRAVARARLPVALRDEEDESDESFRVRQRRRRMEESALGPDEADVDEEVPFNLESFDVPVKEWLTQEATRAEVKRRFRWFLQTYTDESKRIVYNSVIERMCAANGQSLVVNYIHISQMIPIIAIWLADVPKQMLEILDEVAKEVVLSKYEDYGLIQQEIFVRISDLPVVDSLRDLRQFHLGVLIKVNGVVTRRTGIFPQLKVLHYSCQKCGNVIGPFVNMSEKEATVSICAECQSTGPFTLNSEQTVYRNFQKLTLQETPGSVPAGRVPRSKEVILLADLVDSCRPGDEVDITGIYTHNFDASLNTRQGFPVFSTVIEANFVQRRQDARASNNLTEEDKKQILDLSRDPNIVDRITRSLAPSIFGHDHVKMALAMSLFGGEEKDVQGKHRIRGDINVLMLGDPGTAKSQFLKYIERTAPRAVFTTGKGASAVGLTASVHKDPLTGEWTLEGGALVLADRGVCLIDEFDKMNDSDRTSIHEAMEQQSISISKAGIVTTLQARCGVMAAANPVGGRYDASKTFTENVELTDPIIQRFDILCVLQDTVDPIADEHLAGFVVDSHMASKPVAPAGTTEADAGAPQPPPAAPRDKSIIPQDLLRKYLMYARDNVRPSLVHINTDKVAKLYTELRRESEISRGIPIAVRHIESVMRMSEAHARMHLRPVVQDEDVDMAIRVMLESFIQAQKLSVTRTLRRQFSKYLTFRRQFNDILMFELQGLVKSKQLLEASRLGEAPKRVDIPLAELDARARSLGINDISGFLSSAEVAREGFLVNSQRKLISRDL